MAMIDGLRSEVRPTFTIDSSDAALAMETEGPTAAAFTEKFATNGQLKVPSVIQRIMSRVNGAPLEAFIASTKALVRQQMAYEADGKSPSQRAEYALEEISRWNGESPAAEPTDQIIR